MILYRPVGLQELALIYDSGMRAFPARLPQQPIFYPVLQLEYARQTASKWNAKSGQSAGYVTQFKVEDEYINPFEKHTVGGSQHQELWIPAEEVDEFNKHIIGHIKVLEAHFGDAFEGFVPETFGLQGKNAVEQFTLLANSYLYKRMDFYLEIKRNHKAVFLNYPFWQNYAFKNPGLKEKILQAIKEAWLTAFPKNPLPLPPPVPKDDPLIKQTGMHASSSVEAVRGDITPVKQTHARALPSVEPAQEDVTPLKQTYAQSLVEADDEDNTTEEQNSADTYSSVDPLEEDITAEEQTDTDAYSLDDLSEEDTMPGEQIHAKPRFFLYPVDTETTLRGKTDEHAHFLRGIKLGLGGEYGEAIGELSRAVEEDSDHVVARTSLGVAFHRLGEDDRALDCYEAALRLDPKDAEAHYFRANILYARGNVREAIAGYTMAISLKPDLIKPHEEGTPQDRLTDYSTTPAGMHSIAKPARRILDLNKLLETNSRQANLLKERAAEYYRLLNYEQAIADYSASLAIQPDDARALHLRGVAYEQLGQSDRALADYQQAIAIDPQISDVYIQRGVTFGNTGNFRQSIASFTEAIRLAPENPDGYFNRGTTYFQQRDLERAIEDFSKVIQLSPGDEAAYYWRGISNEEADHPPEAIADYRQFLTLSQDASAREEIEYRLSQWQAGARDDPGSLRGLLGIIGRRLRSRSGLPDNRQNTNDIPPEQPVGELDLYHLLVALGERARHSIWFGSGVECYGEKAEELYAFTDQDRPIEGSEFLSITSGIRQTIAGDFYAMDPGGAAHWILIRAWDGSGFYIEINEPNSKQQLRAHFPSAEEVDGASPPYEGLFIRI